MILTERDKRIVEAVYQCRVLRQDQIHRLFFGTSKAASQRRLALLYHHGFLNRVFLTVRASYMLSPALYMLDRRGAELLRSELGYDDLTWKSKSHDVGQPFLEHTLAINDVRVAATIASKKHGYSLLTWRSEADLKAEYDRVVIQEKNSGKQLVSLIPDSFFVVETTRGKSPFFLEVDRGTETTGRFQTKVRAYQAYVQSGAYEKRYGYKSIRVLTVTFSRKRLDSLKSATGEAGGKERYWFALHSDIHSYTLFDEPIWSIAGDTSQRTLF